jgi:hypothetical protein
MKYFSEKEKRLFQTDKKGVRKPVNENNKNRRSLLYDYCMFEITKNRIR